MVGGLSDLGIMYMYIGYLEGTWDLTNAGLYISGL